MTDKAVTAFLCIDTPPFSLLQRTIYFAGFSFIDQRRRLFNTSYSVSGDYC